MSETETDYEQSDDQVSASEFEVQRRPHKGGKGSHHKREEPTSLTDLQGWILQGENESVSKVVDRGTKTEKEAKSPPYLG